MEGLRNLVEEDEFWRREQSEFERRLKSRMAIRKRRLDPEIREREREKNLIAMRRRRENPETREKERERNRIAMRLKRQDPEFREKEKLAIKMKRITNPDVKERDKIAHRIRRQNPEIREYERQRQRCLAMQKFSQQFEIAETTSHPSFFFPEEAPEPAWKAAVIMEEGRILRTTDEVEVIPFGNVAIKQEEVESSDSVDMMAPYQEKGKEGQNQEVEMDPTLTATMMGVVLKDDSNASSGEVEELVVEPSLLEFRCLNEDEKYENQLDEVLPPSTMVLVPEMTSPQNFFDENLYDHPVSVTKKLKYTLNKTNEIVYRCPNCSLSLTSAEYLSRHLRRGCRFRECPIKNAYRCTICGEHFSNYGELFQHKRKSHEAAFKPRQLGRPKAADDCDGPSHEGTVDVTVSEAPPAPHPFHQLSPALAAFAQQYQANPWILQLLMPGGSSLPASTSGVVSPNAAAASSVVSCRPAAPQADVSRTTSSSRMTGTPQAVALGSAGCSSNLRGNADGHRGSSPPDLVFSSSGAVNHFASVVPDVAVSTSSNMPDVADGLPTSYAPDIVSCSRPERFAQQGSPRFSTSFESLNSEGAPPDLVSVSPLCNRFKRDPATAEGSRQVLRSDDGNLVRLNNSACKRKMSEAASTSG